MLHSIKAERIASSMWFISVRDPKKMFQNFSAGNRRNVRSVTASDDDRVCSSLMGEMLQWNAPYMLWTMKTLAWWLGSVSHITTRQVMRVLSRYNVHSHILWTPQSTRHCGGAYYSNTLLCWLLAPRGVHGAAAAVTDWLRGHQWEW